MLSRSRSRSASTSRTSSIDVAAECINVVVRCRGRVQREIDAKSPVVVEVPETKESDKPTNRVTVSTSADFSISEQMNSARTYQVDKVYGAEATQERFFKGVAQPLCDEFVRGYNCTIFSYGQTGAGKTYTMCGDVGRKVADKDELPADYGIIPRILRHLFETLGSVAADYVVKCSFVEIYNEELKDLLANTHDFSRLRIYEHKKGDDKTIHIDGLEEFQVHSLRDGLALLQQGTRRRRTASTKLNDRSSRSHSIFTISLLAKKSASDKEFRSSKLNLVDLAGSENIMRAGSVNMRAKEAGSINQSLLTLGRVINCLADGSSYVPYRESKLTRLLQDSLGGRTKTILVANVSPVMADVQATLSTLEYASRAKNIKNAVQIGPVISDESLVRKLVEENYRLKLDMKATRAKEGVYLDQENYSTLLLECKNLKNEVKELRQQHEAASVQLEKRTLQLETETAEKTQCLASLAQLEKTMVSYQNRLNQQQTANEELTAVAHKLMRLASDDLGKLHSEQEEALRFVQGLLHEKMDPLSQSLQTLENLDPVPSQEEMLAEAGKIAEYIAGIRGSFETVCERQKQLAEMSTSGMDNLSKVQEALDKSIGSIEKCAGDNKELLGQSRQVNEDMYSFVTHDVFPANDSQLASQLLLLNSSKIEQFQEDFSRRIGTLFAEISRDSTANLKDLLLSKLHKQADKWHGEVTAVQQKLEASNDDLTGQITGLSAATKSQLGDVLGRLQREAAKHPDIIDAAQKSLDEVSGFVESTDKMKENCVQLYDRERQFKEKLEDCSKTVSSLSQELRDSLDGKYQLTEKRHSAVVSDLSALKAGAPASILETPVRKRKLEVLDHPPSKKLAKSKLALS